MLKSNRTYLASPRLYWCGCKFQIFSTSILRKMHKCFGWSQLSKTCARERKCRISLSKFFFLFLFLLYTKAFLLPFEARTLYFFQRETLFYIVWLTLSFVSLLMHFLLKEMAFFFLKHDSLNFWRLKCLILTNAILGMKNTVWKMFVIWIPCHNLLLNEVAQPILGGNSNWGWGIQLCR